MEWRTVVASIRSVGGTLEGGREEIVEREGESGRVEANEDEVGESVEHLRRNSIMSRVFLRSRAEMSPLFESARDRLEHRNIQSVGRKAVSETFSTARKAERSYIKRDKDMKNCDGCDYEDEKCRSSDDSNHVCDLLLTSNMTSKCESTCIEDEVDDTEEERGEWIVKDEVFETGLS